MRIVDSGTTKYINRAYQNVNVSADGFASLSVESGRIDLGFFNGKTAGSITLSGGTLAAIGETTEVGTLDADSLTWAGGNIAVDIESATSADKIVATSFDIATEVTDLAITFNISNDFDIAKYLEGVDELTYTIIEATSGTFLQSDADKIIVNGLSDNIDCKFNVVDNSLVATFTAAVPEPSEIAIIFGALALGLALYRRRK